MRALLALALCAFAYATFERRIPNPEWLNEIVELDSREWRENAFRAQKEYRYLYNAQLCTGIPQSSRQHACTRIQALVSLVFRGQEQLLVQLTHIRMGQLNQHIPNPREILPFEAYEEIPVEQEKLEKCQLPVQCQYKDGLVKEIVFDGEEQPWSANIKRGVLNMLQINLKQHARTDLSEEQLLFNRAQAPQDEQNDFFACQERTLEGDCETYYTITKQPNTWYGTDKQVMNITKTVNFEKCRHRPDIRYNQRFAAQCPTCQRKMAQQEKMLESATVARFNVSGTPESFLIEKACVESHYMFAPLNEQSDIVATYGNQTLELIKSGPIETRVPEPNNPQPSDSQMVYTPDWDILKEKFFMEGDQQFLDQSPYSEIKNKLRIVQHIVARLIAYTKNHEMGFEQEAPRQLARLVKVLRMCTQQELNQIHQKIYEECENIEQPEQQKVKDILTDAMALAATKNTIQHLVKNIQQKKVNPIKGAMALKGLMNARVISEQQIDIVWDLCKHQVSQRNGVLKQSCYLTLGSMINGLCAPNKDQLAVEYKVEQRQFCPRQLKEKYLQELIRLFETAENEYEKILALKTIANAGIDLAAFELEKIIKNTGLNAPHQSLVRMQAIDALRNLRATMPRKIQKMLMPVYKNMMELCHVRMTAVYQILQTMPEKPILDQIAQHLMQERCEHMVTFVQTLMTSLANSSNVCEQQLAQDLQLSLRHARQQPWVQSLATARFYHFDIFCQEHNIGAAFNFGKLYSNRSLIPYDIMVSLDQVLGGQWMKNVLLAGYAQQNVETLLDRFFGAQGRFYERYLGQHFTRAKRSHSPPEQPKGLLYKIYEKLRITGRRDQSQQPMGLFYLRYKDMDYAMLPISHETNPEKIRQIFTEEYKFNLEPLQELLSQGYHMDFHTAAFVHEQSRKIPTALGIPLLVSGKAPTIAGIKGFVKAEFQPRGELKQIRAQINAQPRLATNWITKVEAWTPIVNHGLKVVRSAQVNLPLSVELELDLTKQQPELEIQINTPEQKFDLLKLDARPVTYTRVWPKFLKTYEEPKERTIFGEEWDRMNTINKQFGEHVLGVQMNVHGKYHRTPMRAIAGTPLGAFAGHSFIHVTVQPGQQPPKKVVLKANAELFSQFEDSFELIPEEFEQFYQTEQEKQLFEDEYDQEQPRAHFQKFHRYAQSYRGQNPMKHRIQVQLETRGSSVPRKAELVAKCDCDQNMRLCKWQAEIVRTPIPSGPYREQQPWELQVQGQIFYPKIPFTLQALEEFDLQDSQRAGIQMECEWGQRGQKNQYVRVKVQGERSERQRQLQQQSLYQQTYLRQRDSRLFSPVMQYDELVKQAMLTKYKVHCEYNVNECIQNVTNKAYRMFKAYNWWNTDVNQVDVQNPQKQIQAVIEIEPKNYQNVNITMRTPRENFKLIDMSLYVPIKPINIRRASSPIRSFPELIRSFGSSYAEQAKCVVSSERISTFDQVKYRVPLTTCYSVLAKDCSGYGQQPKFAVLMKKLQQQNEAKKVKIISQQHTVELEAKEEEYSIDEQEPVKVWINGRQINLKQQQQEIITEHEHVVCQVEKVGPYVKVMLPEEGVTVYFDGYACSIKTSYLYKNAQCGLCGHFDGNSEDEWRNPQNQLVQDIQTFHKSYFHQDDDCQINDEIVNNQEQYQYQPFQWEDEQWQDKVEQKAKFWQQENYEQSSEEETSSSEEDFWNEHDERIFTNQYQEDEVLPREMTVVVEMADEICFSKTPVKQCPRFTYPKQAQKAQKVAFGCMSRSSSQAQAWRLLAQEQEKVLDTDSLPQGMVQSVLVPKMCKQLNN